MGRRGLSWCLALGLWAACGDGGAPGELADGAAEETDSDAGLVDPGEDADAESPVGEPVGDGLEVRIGPSGGTLTSADGALTLRVPAGALDSEQTLSVQPIAPAAPQHTGKAFRLGPEGTTFAQPVTLSLRYEDADVAGSGPELLRVAYQDAAGAWHMYKQVSLDRSTKTVSVETTHFSDWSLILGAQILPLEAKVKVSESIELKVVSCLEPHSESDGMVAIEFGYDCESEPAINVITTGWSVNGTLGGTVDAGGIIAADPLSGRATYSAPWKKPSQNPVAVSVEMRDYLTELFGVQTLVSNITILDDSAKWSGTITYEAEGSQTIEGQSGFVGSETHTYSHKTTFEVTGVTGRQGPSTDITLKQSSAVSYEKEGKMRKEGYEICQAGGPVILRHLFEYEIGSWLVGNLEADIDGRIYIGDDGNYNISVDFDYIDLDGQEVVVDKYTHFCSGEVSDNSGTKELHSVEGVGEDYFEGTLDPAKPMVLSGGYEETLTDAMNTTIKVSWNLTRSDDGT